MRLTARGRGLLALAAGLYVAAYAFQRLAPALLATAVLAYLAYARLRLTHMLDDVAFAADTQGPREVAFADQAVGLAYRLRVHPPGLRLQLGFPDREDLAVEELALSQDEVYPTGAVYTFEARVRPHRRGRFVLDELHAELGGPDGLLEHAYELHATVEFTAQAPRSALRAGAQMRELQEIAASPQASPGDVSLELLTHRPYRPSDRDRDIDWKVSARRQELLTRVHRQEIDRELVVLVDATRPMRYQRGGTSMLDHTGKLALAMIRNAQNQGSEVGFAAYDEDSVLGYRQPGADSAVPRQAARLIARLPDPIELTGGDLVVPQVQRAPTGEPSEFERTVAAFRTGGQRLPNGLAEAVNAVHREGHPRTYVVFTPHIHRPREAERIFTRLAQGANRVLVATPFAPRYLGVDRDLRPRDVAKAKQAWDEHRERLARLEAAGIDVVDLSPDLEPRELVTAARGGPG